MKNGQAEEGGCPPTVAALPEEEERLQVSIQEEEVTDSKAGGEGEMAKPKKGVVPPQLRPFLFAKKEHGSKSSSAKNVSKPK